MLDGDGIVYYYGKILGGAEFQPLDDFGTGNAGCTTIQYKNTAGKWENL